MKLWEKILCGHKWKLLEHAEAWSREYDKRPEYLIKIYACETCGKIKKFKIS